MLPEYLTQLRQQSRLTPRGWAESSGISRPTLWRWEKGKTLPRDEELRCALKALSATTRQHDHAFDLLYRERVKRGVGSLPPLTGAGIKPSDLLRALRLRRQLTQREAATRLSVHRVTLASWEAGEHWPDVACLHAACLLYRASPDEVAALTTLSFPSQSQLPAEPDEVVWDDIETYDGDFAQLELRYLTCRAQLAQMRSDFARKQEVACRLDYIHSFFVQSRGAESRRELQRLASNPILLDSPALFAYHQRLWAAAQKDDSQGHRVAEATFRSLLDHGDTLPLGERCRAKGELADRYSARGDYEAGLRLGTSAFKDAQSSDDVHLGAIAQRQYTALLIEAGQFQDAEEALKHFPTHTPLFAVQQVFTYALLLHKAGSLSEAASAYVEAARVSRLAGMTGYADHFARLGSTVTVVSAP